MMAMMIAVVGSCSVDAGGDGGREIVQGGVAGGAAIATEVGGWSGENRAASDGARRACGFIMTRLAVFGTFTALLTSRSHHFTQYQYYTRCCFGGARPRPLPARPLRDAFAALE